MASGFGRRFGSNKLLAEVDSVPLYHRAMAALAPAEFDRAVVCSPIRKFWLLVNDSDFFRSITAVRRRDLRLHSLGPGPDVGPGGGALCRLRPALVDHKKYHLPQKFLLESPDAIYALSWQGRRGNPVVFPADLFGELAALTGDTGGGAVIRRHPERLRLVEAFSPNELLDVDNPEALS